MDGLGLDNCPICLGKFKDAHLLHGCGHMYCRRCLARTVRASRDSFVCPMCRARPADYIPRPLRLARIATPVIALRPAFPPPTSAEPQCSPAPSAPCDVTLQPSDNGSVAVAIAVHAQQSQASGSENHGPYYGYGYHQAYQPPHSCGMPRWLLMLWAGMVCVLLKQVVAGGVAWALWQSTEDTISWMSEGLLWCKPSPEALSDCRGLGDDVTEDMKYGGMIAPAHVLRSLQIAAVVYITFQVFNVWMEICILKSSFTTHLEAHRRGVMQPLLQDGQAPDSPRYYWMLRMLELTFPSVGDSHEEMSDSWCYRTWLVSCLGLHGLIGIFHVPLVAFLDTDETGSACVKPLSNDFCPYSENWFNDLKDFRLFVLLGMAGWVVLIMLAASSACSALNPGRRMSRADRDQMRNLFVLMVMAPLLWVSAILVLYGVMGAWTTFLARPSLLVLLLHTAGTFVISRAVLYNDDQDDIDVMSSTVSTPAGQYEYSPL